MGVPTWGMGTVFGFYCARRPGFKDNRRYSAATFRRFLMISMISAAAVGMWVPGP